MKKLLLISTLILLASCSDGSGARKVLSAQGMTNIEITGHSFFSCGKDDSFSTGFKATSVNGQQVEGTVCKGIFKGSTVRFDD